MNIVVVVSGGLTEVLQATPLLRTLEAGLPDAHLLLAGPRSCEQVIGRLPGVAETLPLGGLDARLRPLGIPYMWLQLRRRRIDVAVLCTTSPYARIAVYLAGIPERLGLGGGLTALLLSDKIEAGEDENNALAWVRLASLLGVAHELYQPAFLADPTGEQRWRSRLTESGLDNGRLLVAIAPGLAMGEHRQAPPAVLWQSERFAYLANQLARRHAAGIVILGTTADRKVVDEVLVDLDAPVIDLCGDLSFAETAGVIARCDLLVCGDSPLLHLAAAMGTPSVGLFGPTEGRRRAPCGQDHRVVQGLRGELDTDGAESPIARIRVEDVIASIESSM